MTELDLKKILKMPNSDKELNVIMVLILTQFYFIKSIENKNKIRNQLKQCELFLDSDMCRRNNTLKKQIQIEATYLKKGFKYDNMISLFISILN